MHCIKNANGGEILSRLTKDFGVEEEDGKEDEMEAGEENFVIAKFKAGEFLAAVHDKKYSIREAVSNTDSCWRVPCCDAWQEILYQRGYEQHRQSLESSLLRCMTGNPLSERLWATQTVAGEFLAAVHDRNLLSERLWAIQTIAGEFLAAVHDRKSSIREVVSNTDSRWRVPCCSAWQEILYQRGCEQHRQSLESSLLQCMTGNPLSERLWATQTVAGEFLAAVHDWKSSIREVVSNTDSRWRVPCCSAWQEILYQRGCEQHRQSLESSLLQCMTGNPLSERLWVTQTVAGEFLAAVHDRKSSIREVVSNTDSRWRVPCCSAWLEILYQRGCEQHKQLLESSLL